MALISAREKISEVTLACGHTAQNVPCHQAQKPESIVCRVKVSFPMPACGHMLSIPCNETSKYANNPELCPERVKFQMTACGHEMQAPCGRKKQVLANPQHCNHPCGGILPNCEHVCQARCGDCFAHSQGSDQNKPAAGDQTTPAKSFAAKHLPCKQTCGKVLLCGHQCQAPCHIGTTCKGKCSACCRIASMLVP